MERQFSTDSYPFETFVPDSCRPPSSPDEVPASLPVHEILDSCPVEAVPDSCPLDEVPDSCPLDEVPDSCPPDYAHPVTGEEGCHVSKEEDFIPLPSSSFDDGHETGEDNGSECPITVPHSSAPDGDSGSPNMMSSSLTEMKILPKPFLNG